jgi:hypothetical protein
LRAVLTRARLWRRWAGAKSRSGAQVATTAPDATSTHSFASAMSAFRQWQSRSQRPTLGAKRSCTTPIARVCFGSILRVRKDSAQPGPSTPAGRSCAHERLTMAIDLIAASCFMVSPKATAASTDVTAPRAKIQVPIPHLGVARSAALCIIGEYISTSDSCGKAARERGNCIAVRREAKGRLQWRSTGQAYL